MREQKKIKIRVNFLRPLSDKELEGLWIWGEVTPTYFIPRDTQCWFVNCKDWAIKNIMNIANINFYVGKDTPVNMITFGNHYVKNGLLGEKFEGGYRK